LRIVAGALRGRPFVAPKGHSTRPTSDRTRQAIFNVLEHASWAPEIDGARVIDLFGGSGAMGLEALSRGAAFCRFVELGEAAAAAIRANVESLGLVDHCAIDRRDATRLGPRADGEPEADFAFADPPYREALGEAALAALLAGGWLAPTAVVVLEQDWRDGARDPPGYHRLDERLWGAARVRFFGPR